MRSVVSLTDDTTVVPFKRVRHRPRAPAAGPDVIDPQYAQLPVLACVCGSTLVEMHGGGRISCARCHRVAPNARWRWVNGPKEPV